MRQPYVLLVPVMLVLSSETVGGQEPSPRIMACPTGPELECPCLEVRGSVSHVLGRIVVGHFDCDMPQLDVIRGATHYVGRIRVIARIGTLFVGYVNLLRSGDRVKEHDTIRHIC